MPHSIPSQLPWSPASLDGRGPSVERARSPERQDFAAELQRAGGARRTESPPRVVEPERTPLTGEQAANAIANAWRERFGEPPSARSLSIMTAQWAHETGRGRSMLNFNFGGIKGTGPSGLTTSYRTREGWGRDEVRIVDGFRAYASAAEGAADYVGLLARRYPAAIEAAREGDPAAFVRALKARGYFTGHEGAYVKSVTALSRQALASGFDAIGARAAAGSGAAASANLRSHAVAPPPAAHPFAPAARARADTVALLEHAEAAVSIRWGDQMDDAIRRTELLMAALDLSLGSSERNNGR